MRAHTLDVHYLHTLVRYYAVPKTIDLDPKDVTFDVDGRLVLKGVETIDVEREVLVRRGNPYAVKWELAWFEIDRRDDDEDPPTSVSRDPNENDDGEAYAKTSRLIAHHHVAITARTDVTNDTEYGRTAQGIIDDYPNVDEIEFRFEDDRVIVDFENHEGRLTLPLREVARKTREEPHAVYLGHGKLLREDESWTMCEQRARSLEKKIEELELHVELLEEDRKRQDARERTERRGRRDEDERQ